MPFSKTLRRLKKRCSDAILSRRIQKQCVSSVGTFKKILPLVWRPRTVLLSEGFAFCALCELFGIETVIESGVFDGRSTEIWTRFQPHSQKIKRIYAIDVKFRPGVFTRLGAESSLTLLE